MKNHFIFFFPYKNGFISCLPMEYVMNPNNKQNLSFHLPSTPSSTLQAVPLNVSLNPEVRLILFPGLICGIVRPVVHP